MIGQKIVILDYGMGNLGSIRNMFGHIGMDTIISSQISDIETASKIILAGVGAFDTAVDQIHGLGLLELLNRRVLVDRIPVLGICLGMQLLTEKSDEGKRSGLGWIKGETVRFQFNGASQPLKVPHMRWNGVDLTKKSKLFTNMPRSPRFYFVHSYHVVCKDKADVLSTTPYGYDFASAVEKDNIFGTQFHPEKSHKFGMQLLRNFSTLV